MLEFRTGLLPTGVERMKLSKLVNLSGRFGHIFSENFSRWTCVIVIVLSTSLVNSGACSKNADAYVASASYPSSKTLGEVSDNLNKRQDPVDISSRTSRQLLLRDAFRSVACLPKYFCMLSAQKPSKSTSSWNDMLYMLRFAISETDDSDEENEKTASKSYHHRLGSGKRQPDNNADIDDLIKILRPKVERRKSESSSEIGSNEGLLLDETADDANKGSTLSKIISKVKGFFRTERSSSLWKNKDFWDQMVFAARVGQEPDTSGEMHGKQSRAEIKCSKAFTRCRLSFDEMKQVIDGEPWVGETTNQLFENAADLAGWLDEEDTVGSDSLKFRKIKQPVKRTPVVEDDELEELIPKPKRKKDFDDHRKGGKSKGKNSPKEKESSEEEDPEHQPKVPNLRPPTLPQPRPTPVLYDYTPIFPWLSSQLFGSKRPPPRHNFRPPAKEQGVGRERPIRIKNAVRPWFPRIRNRPPRPETKWAPNKSPPPPPQEPWTAEPKEEKKSSEEGWQQSSEEREVPEVEIYTKDDEIEKQWEGVVAKDIEVYLKTTTQAPIPRTSTRRPVTSTTKRTTTTVKTTTGTYQDNLKKVVDDVIKTSFPKNTSVHVKSDLKEFVGSLLQNSLSTTPRSVEQEMQTQFLALMQQLQETQRRKMTTPAPNPTTFPFLGSSGFVSGSPSQNPYSIYQNQFTNQGSNTNNYFQNGHQNAYGSPYPKGPLTQFSFYPPQSHQQPAFQPEPLQSHYPAPQGFQEGNTPYVPLTPQSWDVGFSEQELQQYLMHNGDSFFSKKMMANKRKVKPHRGGGTRRKAPKPAEVPEDHEEFLAEQHRIQLETADQLHRLAQEQLSLAEKQSQQM